ncbi:MAG: glutaredoxin family protein [Candidatus Hodarchaeaceae archaeon]|nr:glutaredoxin family protein [Candidatus Hodarchaeaceae archaeon]
MKVKIYTTPFCPYCQMAKEFLVQHGIEFEEVNVQEDRAAAIEMIQKTGQNGVPVLEIGDKIIVGFNREKIIEALKS